MATIIETSHQSGRGDCGKSVASAAKQDPSVGAGDPVFLFHNALQRIAVLFCRKNLLQMTCVTLLVQRFSFHAESLALVFPDAAPELDVGYIELGLFLRNVVIEKLDESGYFFVVKLTSDLIYAFGIG